MQSGGDGPHSGDRDDSIGLARAKTHAYAGLRAAAGAEPLRTAQLESKCGRLSVLASLDGPAAAIKVAAAVRRGGDEAASTAWQRAELVVPTESDAAVRRDAQWFELRWDGGRGTLFGSGENALSVALEIEAASATVFAIRAQC